MKRLDHPNIVRLFETLEDSEVRHLFPKVQLSVLTLAGPQLRQCPSFLIACCPFSQNVFLLMELCHGGDLFSPPQRSFSRVFKHTRS
eukprot:1214490-Amphidinium_carterae.1